MTTVKHKTTGKISNVDSTYADRVKQQVTVYLKDRDDKTESVLLSELMRDYEVVPEESKVKIPGQFRTKTGYIYCPFFSKLTGPYAGTKDADWCEILASAGLSFETEAECSKWIKKQEAEQILLQDTKGFKPDWKNVDEEKVFVYYDYRLHGLTYLGRDYCNDGVIIFANVDDATASIKAHPNEWKTYLGVEE